MPEMSFNKIKTGIWLLLLLSTILITPPVSGEQLKFEQLSLDEGAALNLTYCMLQDHKGFMWFGTMYGLVKYDGKSYNIYKNNPDDSNSISFDDIISLFEDSENNIWIGTWGGGLNKFDPSTEKFTRFVNDLSTPGGISDNIVWTISEDNEGNLWFGTETGGLSKYDLGKNVFRQYFHSDSNPQGISSNSVHNLYKDRRGTLWICSRSGLSKYVKSSDSFINYKLKPVNNKRNPRINSVMQGNDRSLLIGTSEGLYNFNINSERFTRINIPEINEKYIHTLCKKDDNTIWTGTISGLFSIDLSENEVTEYHSVNNDPASTGRDNVLNLLVDKSGILWINSYGNGISKLKNTKSMFLSYYAESGKKNSLSSSRITSFCIDRNNNIWTGTNGGLNMFDKATGKFVKFASPTQVVNRIRSIAADDNLLWLGTAGGIELFDISSKIFKDPPPPVKGQDILNKSAVAAILKTGDGDIYIGTYGNGLFVYSPESDKIDKYTSEQFESGNMRSDYILTFYQDNLNSRIIWMGTYGGLIKMNTNTKSFEIFRHQLNDSKSLSNDYVFSITRDSFKNLWIGTANGLNKFDESSKSFTHYFEKDGLPNSVISSIIKDNNGKLWISTNYGISEYDISKNEFRNYDKRDGIRNNLYLNHSSLIDNDGDIYFGGINGFDIIRPYESKENYMPEVYITSVKKMNSSGGRTEVTAGSNLELNYDENFIDINFISLDYNNPLKNQYKYKLDGVDEDWVNAGNNNKANYTDLDPGEYVFRVKGSNSSGVFNPDEASLNITILPPFWKTTWFNTILVMLLLAGVYFIYRIKVRQKINRALQLERIKEEESEKLRTKTAADFHDELGHRLTRISLLSEIIKRKIGNTSAEVTDLLEKISVNSMELYEGTKDFIWAIDPGRDSVYELLIRLKDFGDELFEDSDILFEVNGLDESLKDRTLSMDWKRHLAMIFKEGMNNSLKHGMGSKIVIDSKVKTDIIELTLSDNGKGFTPDTTDKGNGLRNMKKRAEKLFAELEVESSPGNGTKIYFKGKIPHKVIHYN